jgi:hypothetical protein
MTAATYTICLIIFRKAEMGKSDGATQSPSAVSLSSSEGTLRERGGLAKTHF